jgi:broad specificity phosphatase PhoE
VERAERHGVVLVLVRHGQQERTGQDGPLTPRGLQQAAAAGAAVALTASDLLVSSSRRRARQTAELIGGAAEVFDDLDEFRFGTDWTWQQGDAREDLVLWRPEHRFGDESMAEFQQRVDRVVDALVQRDPPGRIVMCVHSGVIDAIVRWAFGHTPDTPWTIEVAVPHASITELQYWPTGRHLRGAPRHTLLIRVGDAGHLSPDLRTE